MKETTRNEKAITLIALVITIIVLLIIAGISISMLSGDNGLLRQATNAKEKSEKTELLEIIKLAATAATTNENHMIESKESLETEIFKQLSNDDVSVEEYGSEYKVKLKKEEITYIVSSDGEVRKETEIDILKESGEFVNEVKTMTDANGEKITIPVGFKIHSDSNSGAPSSTIVKKGIVIEDSEQNQFVWIPVKDVNTMYEEKAFSDGTTKKVSKLYDFQSDGTYSQIEWKENKGLREPDILTDAQEGDATPEGIELLKSEIKITGSDDAQILDNWKAQLQDEFDKMIESVKTNGGFYVGRYETSLNEDKVQSKKGEKSLTANNDDARWYGIYQKQKTYTNDYVVSGMIYGCQWDQMMIWMKNNNINVTSNSPIKGAIRNEGKTTGDEEGDKLNNVYDLIGRRREWTMEVHNSQHRVLRGGTSKENDGVPATRASNNSPHKDNGYNSSRLMLYVAE